MTSTAGRTQLAKFVLNYIRREFDTNDEGSRVAYFELLANFENGDVRQMLATYAQRGRWEGDDYVAFLDQLAAVEAKQEKRAETAVEVRHLKRHPANVRKR